jgi:serine/threonine protein kinase
MYDTKKEAYCKWRNGVPTDGSLRAPEENVDAGLSEQIDVFSLGNVFYEVLTGIELWEGYEKAEKIRRVVEGEPMEIDGIFFQTFSFEVLAQAILLCWTYDAEERPTIFEIIKFLEQGIESNLRNPHGGSMKERLASGEEFDLYGGVSTIL